MDKEEFLEIKGEKISLADRINAIMEKLTGVENLIFQDLFEGVADRRAIIYTLLAILELMKLRMIKVYQSGPFGAIRIFPAVAEDASQENREEA
jgi:segregation and condensation protein A